MGIHEQSEDITKILFQNGVSTASDVTQNSSRVWDSVLLKPSLITLGLSDSKGNDGVGTDLVYTKEKLLWGYAKGYVKESCRTTID